MNPVQRRITVKLLHILVAVSLLLNLAPAAGRATPPRAEHAEGTPARTQNVEEKGRAREWRSGGAGESVE